MPISFIIPFSHFNKIKPMMAENSNRLKLTQKKLLLSLYVSQSVDNTPESLLPIEVDKNQPPIMSEVMRTGLNLDTSDNPIGLNNSSPMVITP